jgi:hypothetical protein
LRDATAAHCSVAFKTVGDAVQAACHHRAGRARGGGGRLARSTDRVLARTD